MKTGLTPGIFVTALLFMAGPSTNQAGAQGASSAAAVDAAYQAILTNPGLIKTLEEKDSQLRILALIALAQIGEDSGPAVSHMARALEDENGDVRIYAARCLGRLGGVAKPALPALKKAAKADDPVLKKEAALAVKLISP